MAVVGSFLQVFRREWCRMCSRRIYFLSVVLLPLFLIFFMSTIFGTGQMERIPIAIVDADNTATSRSVARNIAAVPTFDVVTWYADDMAARRALERKEIYGYLSIPPDFEADMLHGAGATLCYYYHYALLAVGGEVMSAFEMGLLPVRMAPIVLDAVALGGDENTMETFLLPMETDSHTLYNPSLNYAAYLSQPIFFIMFQVLVLLVTLYAMGHETKYATGENWLQAANGNILAAVLGKLLPYFLFFSAEALLANYIFFEIVRIPFSGSWFVLQLSSILFVIATQSVAVVLFSLFPAFSLVISVVSMVGSLGATLSGLTFPLSAMSPVVRYVAALFPIRHFTRLVQMIVYYNGYLASCWSILALLLLYPLIALLLLPRLKRLILSHRYDTFG